MSITILDFKRDLINEIRVTAETESLLTEDAFFEVITNIMVDSGDIDTADRCYFVKRGIQIDGYAGDPLDADGVLTLFVCEYDNSIELNQSNKSDIEAVCKRASNFVSSCLGSRFFEQLDESSNEYGLADLIRQRWNIIRKIRIIFITTKTLNLRQSLFEPIPVNGVEAQFSCWDLARLHSFAISGKEKEPVNIELSKYGTSLSVLPAYDADSELRSYLCAMPAEMLASIYNDYETQLLEKNVRVFLQAKGSVNKGIKKTLEDEPYRFFAYNNGITATADSIETSLTKHGISLNRITDFQIVNGGQTTASIADASRRGISLSKVYVQMKLNVVSPEKSIEIVPLISKYANSQNRVTEADFFSNHPFHVEFEKLSRRLIAPPKANTTVQTYWFYERARGQYSNAKPSSLSRTERKKFDTLNPRSQLITKTDLAKILNTFQGHPHIVSKGAQASFRFFADSVKQIWEKGTEGSNFVNEKFFRDSVARTILFRYLERHVSLQPWYQGGYRANVVCYSLALLSQRSKSLGRVLDYSKIWSSQDVPPELGDILLEISALAHEHIITPPPGSPSNVTEYAKTERCWQLFNSISFKLPSAYDRFSIDKNKDIAAERSARTSAKTDSIIDLQATLIAKGSSYWSSLLEFCAQKNLVSSRDWTLLSRATQFPGRLLDQDREYQSLNKIMQRAIKSGFKE